MQMKKILKCPVCNKPLTESEYDKALGLWTTKQEHIKHLEAEHKKLKDQEHINRRKLEDEKKKLKRQKSLFRQQAVQQLKQFKAKETQLRQETKQILAEQTKKSAQLLKKQRVRIENSFKQKMNIEIKKGVEKGVEEQKKQLKKHEVDLKKSKNKMAQLENSLKISAKKYEQASQEIKKLKEQIEKGITPQDEGLFEEKELLKKLQELFPQDKFEHPGKGGDIIQVVREQAKEIGKIVYECKKVKHFEKKHIEQTKEARRLRQADFAVLVTNAFPAKKQYYFVEKNVFVISPVSLEPITYTLRESLVRMALLKMNNEAKEKAVQKVYDYLSGNEYNNKMNDVASQLVELGKELSVEIKSHKRSWEKRYKIYRCLYYDIALIDYKLKELVQNRLNNKQKFLPEPKKHFIEIHV